MTRLMDKVLSKNIIECITQDIQWFGLDYVKKRYLTECIMKTLNNEFDIKFYRDNCRINSIIDDRSYEFICSMTFLNSFGLEVLKLNFSEVDAFNMLDCILQFEDFNMKDLVIPIVSANVNMNTYQMILERLPDNYIQISIVQHNLLYNQSIIKLKFLLTVDSLLNDFLYCMYFAYLIDLDCDCRDISLMELVTQRIMENM